MTLHRTGDLVAPPAAAHLIGAPASELGRYTAKGMNEQLRYEAVEFRGQAASEAVISRGDPAELLYVPVAVGPYGDDLAWAQAICAELAVHPDVTVRGNALIGFGHLARRFLRLDRALVEPLLRCGLADPEEYVRGHAQNAVDDVRHYLGWQLAPAV